MRSPTGWGLPDEVHVRSKNPPLSDHGLWDEIRRTIKPLKTPGQGKAESHHHNQGSGQGLGKGLGIALLKSQTAQKILRRAHHAIEPPPLAAFDRRTAQKLSRGQMEPDATIDLHGEGVEAARMKLFHFVEAQRRRGARLVLVITGKGASPFARHTLHGLTHFHAPEREGRLRREVTFWFSESHFRTHVVGFQPAHPRHGGGGAFYVRLRRLADQP